MIKQLLNSIIAKYRDLSLSRRSIICLSLQLRQIIDLLATEKSRHFAQPRRKKLLIIIRGKIFFLFIGRKPITWPANNCLQIMVYSCTMSSNCVWLSVWLQIIFCSCVNETTLFSLLRSLLCKHGRSLRFPKRLKNKLGDRMIKQLLNSVISTSSNNC